MWRPRIGIGIASSPPAIDRSRRSEGRDGAEAKVSAILACLPESGGPFQSTQVMTGTSRMSPAALRTTLCIACGAPENYTGVAYSTMRHHDELGSFDEKGSKSDKEKSLNWEKAGGRALRTPCCRSLICEGCLHRNPRLKSWNPCLWCGLDAPSSSSGVYQEAAGSSVKKTDSEANATKATNDPDEFEPAPRFEAIDPASRHSASASGSGPPALTVAFDVPHTLAPPPTYEYLFDQDVAELASAGPRAPAISQVQSARPQRVSASTGPSHPQTTTFGITLHEQSIDSDEFQPLVHTVRRGDTLRSIALRYSADPHDLLRMNDLPHACLAGNEGLLQARKHVVVRANASASSGIEPETPERAQRKRERMVKR